MTKNLNIEMMQILSDVKSSYKNGNYWVKFYNHVMQSQPELIVEMGLLNGYSLLSFAMGCRDNNKGKILAIDLFEDYPYNHASYAGIQKKLESHNLQQYVTLQKNNALFSDAQFENNSIDLMHIDISNTGDKLESLLKTYHSKLKTNGVILFEGGSVARDNIPWMIKYQCQPIAPILEKPDLSNLYTFFVINNYPSLTICYKNHE